MPAPPTTADAALAQLLGGDPMWREVRTSPDDATLAGLGLGGLVPIRAAWLASPTPDLAAVASGVALQNEPLAAPWLAGLHLGEADAFLGSQPRDDDPRWGRAISGLADIADEPPNRAGGVSPAAWLGVGPERAAALRASLERRVWVAWLGVPRSHLGPVVDATNAWWGEPLGGAPWQALVAAKHRAPLDDLARRGSEEALRVATGWALEEVVAEDASSRAAWRGRVVAATGHEDPYEALTATLRQVFARAQLDAGTDASVARGMVAATALRLVGTCDDAPCGGLDRGATLVAAARLDEDVAPWARVWSAIALRAAVDRLSYGHDTPGYPRAAVDVTDALVARAMPPRDLAPLTRRRPDVWVWSSWGEGMGVPQAVRWEDLRARLVVQLETESHALLGDSALPPTWRSLLTGLAKPAERTE